MKFAAKEFATKKARILGMFRVSRCVMLNEVKHLLCAFLYSLAEQGKGKSRFFVARLLRMTHEGQAFVRLVV